MRKETRLFLSYKRPYKAVCSATLARWIKTVLTTCGIQGYGAHSTRSASTSKAASAGLDVRDILKVADWSRETTFVKFYKRASLSSEHFARAVLA
jgi:hypothetical protein